MGSKTKYHGGKHGGKWPFHTVNPKVFCSGIFEFFPVKASMDTDACYGVKKCGEVVFKKGKMKEKD